MTAAMADGAPRVVVFDIGGVLLEWDPRHLYRNIFDGDEAKVEWFLTHVCTTSWNWMQDIGRPFDEAVAELTARFPEHTQLIAAYHERWEEMVPYAYADAVAILDDAKAAGVPVYAITNFPGEKLELARKRFRFFDLFEGMVVSSEVRLIKPDPAIFIHFLERFGLEAGECVFIDDSPVNAAAAGKLGFHGFAYESAAGLRAALEGWGLLEPVTVPAAP